MSPRGLLAVAVAAAGLAVLPAHAGLPDWAKAIAESAPPVPEASPKWRSRVLLDETRLVVDPKVGTWRVVQRRAEQFLSARVDDTTFGFFAFNDDMKMKKAKGWHLPPGEHATRNLGGSVDITMSDDFVTDAKQRAVALDGVKKGSLVFYEFEAEQKPYTLTETFALGDPEVPVDVARVIVEAPADWSLRHAWLRGAGSAPKRGAGSWTFETQAWVPPEKEVLGPDPSDLEPRLVIALDPPAGTSSSVPALADWNAFAGWFRALAAGRDAPDPAIEHAAKEAIAKAGPAPLDRIRATAVYVRDKVRYLAREVGIGGYTPAAAGKTLSGLYGDCKDKGTLYRAMLSAVGLTSYPILINATAPDTVAVDVPSPRAFDHFVVGVRWPGDAPIPAEVASATIDVPDLGKVLVVDTTDEYAWPGTLPPALAGHRGLLVAPDRGILVTMPAGAPAAHRVERNVDVELLSQGGAAIKLEVRYYGGPAETARVAYATSAIDRRKEAEDDARRVWPSAEVKAYAAERQADDGAYVETMTLALPAGAAELQEGAVGLFSGATSDIARVPVTRRTGPIVFEYPVSVAYASTVRTVPEASGLPSPVEASGDGWSVRSSVTRDASGVHASWSFERSRSRFEPAEFPEAKKMWAAASKAAGGMVMIR